jgi:Spo0E like sporulation regulatory protein
MKYAGYNINFLCPTHNGKFRHHSHGMLQIVCILYNVYKISQRSVDKMYRTIIEYLRAKMIRTAEKRGSLTHPDVVAISQYLDQFIVMVQRRRLTTRTYTKRNVFSIVRPMKSSRKHFVSL